MDNMDKVGLVDWLNHCDKQLAKNKENSKTRKKLVGRKFSYSRSRVGTWNTLASKEYYKVNNSGARKSCKGLNPNVPVFTPRASIAKSVSYPNTSSISSRPPPVAPPRLYPRPHSKMNDSNLPHSYNVVTKNRFAALYKIDELEDIGSNSLIQKTKASQYGPGMKIKKLNMEKMTDSKPLGLVDTISEESTHNSFELSGTEKNVSDDQVC